MKNKILIVGAHWGIVDQTDELLRKACIELGHPTEIFDYQSGRLLKAAGAVKNWIPARWRKALSPRRIGVLNRVEQDRCNRDFVQLVKEARPDMVFVLRGETLNRLSLEAVRSEGIPLINWTSDEPWRFHAPETVSCFDLWALCDRDWVEWIRDNGGRKTLHLPLACDPDLHFPVTSLTAGEKQKWGSPLAFVASYSELRESAMSHLTDLPLGIWGPGWEQAKDAKVKSKVRERRSLEREEWLKVYAAANVAINVHLQGQSGLGLRVWEALACGVCLISDDRGDMHQFLDGCAETFTDFDDLAEKSRELLGNVSRRNKIKSEARQRVMNGHTFKHRAESLIAQAQEIIKAKT